MVRVKVNVSIGSKGEFSGSPIAANSKSKDLEYILIDDGFFSKLSFCLYVVPILDCTCKKSI